MKGRRTDACPLGSFRRPRWVASGSLIFALHEGIGSDCRIGTSLEIARSFGYVFVPFYLDGVQDKKTLLHESSTEMIFDNLHDRAVLKGGSEAKMAVQCDKEVNTLRFEAEALDDGNSKFFQRFLERLEPSTVVCSESSCSSRLTVRTSSFPNEKSTHPGRRQRSQAAPAGPGHSWERRPGTDLS